MEKHVESDHVGKDGELGTIHDQHFKKNIGYFLSSYQ